MSFEPATILKLARSASACRAAVREASVAFEAAAAAALAISMANFAAAIPLFIMFFLQYNIYNWVHQCRDRI